jgi:hypothetical protein
MKNIHLLPTDKPSRLYKSKITQNISMGPIDISQHGDATYNLIIYITSDEEITGFENNIWVIKGERILLWQNTMALVSNNKPKKIILTTDQDLIEDGVQAIDDNFLEWFVKNPSCEFVEIERLEDGKYIDRFADGTIKEGIYENYKIIIPKEEPKQDPTLENSKLALREYILANKEKVTEDLQEMREKSGTGRDETLEEAAKRTYQKGLQDDIDLSFYDGVRLGAEWQTERMYSKVFEWLSSKDYLSDKMEFIQKEFEQFKNK